MSHYRPPSDAELWEHKSRLRKLLGRWKKDGDGRWMRYRFMETGRKYTLMIKWDSELRVWNTLHRKKSFKSRLDAMQSEDNYAVGRGFVLMETL